MTVRLYNTMSRETETIKTIVPDKVTLYTCGLTVYSQPHIGNWVAYIYWDILVRMLQASDYEVHRVQNITDVGHLTSDEDAGEDKMLKGALKEGITAWQVAEKYMHIADDEAYTLLGLVRPHHMPRATEYITQQIDFVKGLEAKGFTYAIDDGVYFDTSKLPDYGKLARLDIDGLQFGARVADTGKKNPTDFALWKFSPKDEKRDMEWDSPWGKGFPGWHLECSVMARELLGDTIDIHTGGIDHIPVHHTNEIAQSEAFTEKPFANSWLHANHIKVDGTKMSKSLGNVYTLQDITDKGYDLNAFKLLVLSKHYRTEGNFTWEILEASQNRLQGYREMAALQWQSAAEASLRGAEHYKDVVRNIVHALQHDLDTPTALTLLSEASDSFKEHLVAPSEQALFKEMLHSIDLLLNLNLAAQEDIEPSQKKLIAARQEARTRKDWARSDEIRDELASDSIAVRDTPHGPIWYRVRP